MLYKDPKQGQERACPVSEGMTHALASGTTKQRVPGKLTVYTRHQAMHDLFSLYCFPVGDGETTEHGGRHYPLFNNTSAN